jgi:hypothetical protein
VRAIVAVLVLVWVWVCDAPPARFRQPSSGENTKQSWFPCAGKTNALRWPGKPAGLRQQPCLNAQCCVCCDRGQYCVLQRLRPSSKEVPRGDSTTANTGDAVTSLPRVTNQASVSVTLPPQSALVVAPLKIGADRVGIYVIAHPDRAQYYFIRSTNFLYRRAFIYVVGVPFHCFVLLTSKEFA